MPTPNEAAQILARALDGAAVTAAVDSQNGSLAVDLNVREQTFRLRAFWAGDGRPHEVRRATHGLPKPWPADAVLVARQLSAASRELLKELGANWADATGQANISGPGLLVIRETRASEPLRRRDFAWSPSTLDAAEALLAHSWPRGVRTGELARTTGWSPAQITDVLQAFDARGWTRKRGPQRGPSSHRVLDDPAGLLNAWTSVSAEADFERRFAHGVAEAPMDLLRGDVGASLNEHVRWAVTGWAATELIAPVMTEIPSLQLYVAEDDFYGPLTDAIRESGLREVDEGGSVEFWSARSGALALSEPRDDLLVASAPRVYADLIRLGGRGEDAAQHLQREVIAPLHQPLTVKPPSQTLRRWHEESERRLHDLVRDSGNDDPYAYGSWSVSYRLRGVSREVTLVTFRDVLEQVKGNETGWPAWWAPGDDSRPHVADGKIECWIGPHVFTDPSHRDFWRGDPHGLLFLLRGFEEDGSFEGLSPGTALDLTLPVWRVGECLLHAERLAQALDADRIELAVTWQGLQGRQLRALANSNRVMFGNLIAHEDTVTSHIEIEAAEVTNVLPDAVRVLVEPLYTAFDFFEPPQNLYREELGQLMGRKPTSWA